MPTNKIATDLRRVQFDILIGRLTELDQLMMDCDISTRKDFFDNAVTLFEWAVEEVRKGNHIASYNKETDKVEVVRFPVLENAMRKAQSTKRISLVSTADGQSDADAPVNDSNPRLSGHPHLLRG